MMTIDDSAAIHHTLKTGGAAQKAKLYDAHVTMLRAEIVELSTQLRKVQADPEHLSKLEVAAQIDPDHLRRLLALEKAVCGAGYCGMPTAS